MSISVTTQHITSKLTHRRTDRPTNIKEQARSSHAQFVTTKTRSLTSSSGVVFTESMLWLKAIEVSVFRALAGAFIEAMSVDLILWTRAGKWKLHQYTPRGRRWRAPKWSDRSARATQVPESSAVPLLSFLRRTLANDYNPNSRRVWMKAWGLLWTTDF